MLTPHFPVATDITDAKGLPFPKERQGVAAGTNPWEPSVWVVVGSRAHGLTTDHPLCRTKQNCFLWVHTPLDWSWENLSVTGRRLTTRSSWSDRRSYQTTKTWYAWILPWTPQSSLYSTTTKNLQAPQIARGHQEFFQAAAACSAGDRGWPGWPMQSSSRRGIRCLPQLRLSRRVTQWLGLSNIFKDNTDESKFWIPMESLDRCFFTSTCCGRTVD